MGNVVYVAARFTRSHHGGCCRWGYRHRLLGPSWLHGLICSRVDCGISEADSSRRRKCHVFHGYCILRRVEDTFARRTCYLFTRPGIELIGSGDCRSVRFYLDNDPSRMIVNSRAIQRGSFTDKGSTDAIFIGTGARSRQVLRGINLFASCD
jgi:hypothetical protein